MDATILSSLNAERQARRAVILVKNLKDGVDRLVREGESVAGELGSHIETAFRTGVSKPVQADGGEYFLNAHLPPPRIVAIGAVHITQALAPIAAVAGYDFEIIDPRTAFATAERFPGVALHAEWPEEVVARRPFDAYTAVAAVTHDPKIDDFALRAALDAGCFYIGALGSRKTHAKRTDRLAALGVTPEALARIHAPIGLAIGASSPAEIAVAVMAQIIGAFRSRALAGSGAAKASA